MSIKLSLAFGFYSLILILLILTGCTPKHLHVADPHCTTNTQGYTLCIR